MKLSCGNLKKIYYKIWNQKKEDWSHGNPRAILEQELENKAIFIGCREGAESRYRQRESQGPAIIETLGG